jgi:ABC-2 type transport system ATP-binding protein
MLDLIKEIPERSQAHLMLSTHILPDVERTCEDVVVMNEGRMLYHGGLDKLMKREQDTFEVRVKGDIKAFKKAVKASGFSITTQGSKIIASLTDDAQASRASTDQDRVDQAMKSLLESAVSTEVQVRHLQPLRATLEQAFLETVKRGSEEAS